MWNHRVDFSIASESIIKSFINDYNYGTRREDQSEISKSGFFDEVISVKAKIIHYQSSKECIEVGNLMPL